MNTVNVTLLNMSQPVIKNVVFDKFHIHTY